MSRSVHLSTAVGIVLVGGAAALFAFQVIPLVATVGLSGRSAEADAPAPPHKPVLVAPRADIVIISVDALRPDHTGVYGYARPTTPHLDRWASHAVVFERAYCQVPHTSFSLSALLTGVSLYPIGSAKHRSPPRTIAEVTRRYGLKTAAFYPPSIFYIDPQELKSYIEQRLGFEYVKYEHLGARERVEQIISFLDEYRDRQVLVWAHFFEPHEPYLSSPSSTFGARALDRYDSEIAEVDRHLGRLLAYLHQHRPQAIIVVTADHGEAFGEHGAYYHGNRLHEPQVRVPLIMKIPGVPGRRVQAAAQLVDISATLLSLLDIPRPWWLQGQDFTPWLRGGVPSVELAAFAELDASKMVVQGSSKLIWELGHNELALYDLEHDPGETTNLAVKQRGRAAKLQRLIEGWLAHRESWGAKGGCPVALSRGRRRDPGAISLLLQRCSSGEERREAIKVLVAMRSTLALPELVRASHDPDPEVRAWAVVGAALVGSQPSMQRVEYMLGANDLPAQLRPRAWLARLRAGDSRSIAPVAEALAQTTDVYAQVELIEALGQFGNRSAVPVLLAQLGSLRTRFATIEALGRLQAAEAVPHLVRSLLEDRFTSWRIAAASALGKIGGLDAIAALRKALHDELEPGVTAAALTALGQLAALPASPLRHLLARAPRCSGKSCRYRLGLSCSSARARQLLALWPLGPLRVLCGDEVVHVEERAVMVLDLPAAGQGPLQVEAPNGARPVYVALRPSNRSTLPRMRDRIPVAD